MIFSAVLLALPGQAVKMFSICNCHEAPPGPEEDAVLQLQTLEELQERRVELGIPEVGQAEVVIDGSIAFYTYPMFDPKSKLLSYKLKPIRYNQMQELHDAFVRDGFDIPPMPGKHYIFYGSTSEYAMDERKLQFKYILQAMFDKRDQDRKKLSFLALEDYMPEFISVTVRDINAGSEQEMRIPIDMPLHDVVKSSDVDRAYVVRQAGCDVGSQTPKEIGLEQGAVLDVRWINDEGSFTFPDGSKYEGEFQNGQQNGQGTMTYANGDRYEGEWQNGLKHGQGTLTIANGDVYTGRFEAGKKHGRGVYTWADGTVYDGEWRDGKKHGRAVYIDYDGDRFRYDGEWRDGQRHGRGTLTYADGEAYQREYNTGRCVREVRFR